MEYRVAVWWIRTGKKILVKGDRAGGNADGGYIQSEMSAKGHE